VFKDCHWHCFKNIETPSNPNFIFRKTCLVTLTLCKHNTSEETCILINMPLWKAVWTYAPWGEGFICSWRNGYWYKGHLADDWYSLCIFCMSRSSFKWWSPNISPRRGLPSSMKQGSKTWDNRSTVYVAKAHAELYWLTQEATRIKNTAGRIRCHNWHDISCDTEICVRARPVRNNLVLRHVLS